MPLTPLQQRAAEIVEELRDEFSGFHHTIWGYAESAWREYRSARLYVERLREEGFEVEQGSGGMPTAFHATWGEGGPHIGMYAEYDASPGYSQEPVARRQPRKGFHPWAPGFTDAHSALGVGGITGAIAAKRTLEESGLPGTIHLFGEPAEKVCGSKAVHAAKGYYDTLDAAISYHPLWFNTALWNITNNLYWSAVFTFQCVETESWGITPKNGGVSGPHNASRSPGAIDALQLMINITKTTKENMFPSTGHWTVNEAILGAANATADNMPPRITQIQFSWRSPLIDIQEQILHILQNNAKHVAGLTNTEVTMRWVTKTRPGLPNHTLTTALFDNMTELGLPEFSDGKLVEFANELETHLGYQATEQPFIEDFYRFTSPQDNDAEIRKDLPEWQECTGADDYTEYSWHAPTVRFFTAKPHLKQVGGELLHWANNAFVGMPEGIDATWVRGGQTIAVTALQLIEDPELLAETQREFQERKMRADPRLLNPLLPKDFQAPVELPWPEYVNTERGFEWTLPTTEYFGEKL